MEKWIAGLLQLAAAALFVAAGAEEEALVFPAAAAQLAGLALWGRHRPARPELPKPEEHALDARLARIEDVLSGVQANTERLRESRDFMEELYAGRQGKPRELREQADRPPQPGFD